MDQDPAAEPAQEKIVDSAKMNERWERQDVLDGVQKEEKDIEKKPKHKDGKRKKAQAR
jgi:hypothetical protein